jgi:quinol monooxygenase YgiN
MFVLATIETTADHRADVLDEFRRIVPLVRQEHGCLAYTPATDVETNIDAQPAPRENVITVVEQWEDLEALEVHLMAPHMLEFRSRVKPWIASVTLHVLGPA